MAYLGAALLLSVAAVRRRPVPVLVIILAAVLVLQPLMYGPLNVSTVLYLHGVRLAGYFLTGMLFWALRTRIRVTTPAGVGSLALSAAIFAWVPIDMFNTLLPLPLAYAVFWLGSVLPIRIGARNDISYGIYIFAYPVQQLLAVSGLTLAWGYWASAVAALVLTGPLAAASWWGIEKPLMRFKRLWG